jgi:hypothetical protein
VGHALAAAGGGSDVRKSDGDVPSSIEMKRMEGEGEKPQMGPDGADGHRYMI